MGPTWGPPGSCRPQMGPMLAPWTLLSGYAFLFNIKICAINVSVWNWIQEYTSIKMIIMKTCRFKRNSGTSISTEQQNTPYNKYYMMLLSLLLSPGRLLIGLYIGDICPSCICCKTFNCQKHIWTYSAKCHVNYSCSISPALHHQGLKGLSTVLITNVDESNDVI